MHKKLIITVCTLLNINLHAEVITDSTLGRVEQTLDGPNFLITDDLGQQKGGNLFHSFSTFNINTGESATFTGASSVENIITRVTGGSQSSINGALISDIEGANLYLLNPSGILFKENAQIDISGSFHASTADYLRLGENGHFSASEPSQSLLTVAQPAAFGFLDNTVASITVQDSFLKIPAEQTLSLIGGDIVIEDGTLFAESGRINLAAVAQKGEVIPSLSDLQVNTFEKLGTITLSQSSSNSFEKRTAYEEGLLDIANLDVSGKGGGQIFIRAGQFFSDKAWVFADIDKNGVQKSSIDILIDQNIHLKNGARITADNLGNSSGGYITITSKILQLSGSNEEEEGIERFSTIATNNFSLFSSATSGNIDIKASELIISPGLIQSATEAIGDAGNIQINAQRLTLSNYGFINAGTHGSGNAGNITIDATDTILLSNFSIISAEAGRNFSGKTGDIKLNTQHLILENGSFIANLGQGIGNSGSIQITTDTAKITGWSSITTEATQARGGNIFFDVHDYLHLFDNSRITAQAYGANLENSGGNITIHKPDFLVLENSLLLAKAYAGNGGKIDINTPQFKVLGDSQIDVSSELGLGGEFLLNKIKLEDDFLALPSLFSFLNSLPLLCVYQDFSVSASSFIIPTEFQFSTTTNFPTSLYDMQPSLLIPMNHSVSDNKR